MRHDKPCSTRKDDCAEKINAESRKFASTIPDNEAWEEKRQKMIDEVMAVGTDLCELPNLDSEV